MAHYRNDVLYIPHSYLGSCLNPNLDLIEQSEVSSRRVITNDHGWRVKSSERAPEKASLVVLGCSWAEGIREDWPNTIAGRLEEQTGKTVINLGVGSYSPLQAIRRLETEANKINPAVVIFVYPNLTERTVKPYSIHGVACRPIFRFDKKTNDIAIIEPRCLPPDLFNEYVRIQRISRSNNPTQLIRSETEIIVFYTKLINGLVGRKLAEPLRTKRYLDIPINDLAVEHTRNCRRKILDYCLRELQRLAESHGFYTLLLPVTRTLVREPTAETSFDLQHFESVIPKKYDRLFCCPVDRVKEQTIKYLQNIGKSKHQVINNVWAPDHSHPNGKGYHLIADTAYQFLVETGLLPA